MKVSLDAKLSPVRTGAKQTADDSRRRNIHGCGFGDNCHRLRTFFDIRRESTPRHGRTCCQAQPQVHQLTIRREGLPSCPDPNFYVTVSPAFHGRALEADLSAFFVQRGLVVSRCQAFVFAFHSRNDYRTHHDNGYTAGRVALATSGQRNLEVDTGSAIDFSQPRFNFNF